MTGDRASLAAALGLAPDAVAAIRDDEWLLEARAADLRDIADRVSAVGGRLTTLFATDERDAAGGFRIHHVWALAESHAFLRVTSAIDAADPSFPSIAAQHPAANWFEREVMDFFGLTPEGHPNPSRVAAHDDWPERQWPLRKDFDPNRIVPRVAGDFHPFRPVTGEGVFQVPVGPVHAGVIEPGHFRFGVAGESVLDLQVRMFYVHKGIEKRFERVPWRHGVFLAESISGDTSVGHALAFAHAIERLAGITPPRRAQLVRSMLLELERMYNHVADIGAIATDVAFAVPASRAQILRERLVRLNDRLFGTRLLRGTVTIGGVRSGLDAAACDALRAHLQGFGREFDGLIKLLVDAGTFTDRIDSTGTLSNQAARDLGVVGLTARASGVDVDARRDFPTDACSDARFSVAVEEGGDVRARFMVRAREVEQSIAILRQLAAELDQAPPAIAAALPAALPPMASALGWCEAWRGPCVHWIATNDRNEIARVKITDPSCLNWPGLVQAVPGNIIPDFPVINKSFNLSYSGNDR